MKTRYILFILPLLLLAGCKPNIDEFSPSKGNADFTKYVAFGDTWTTGFADASLYKSGQEFSFPNILADRFSFAGGGQFKQPLMVDDYGVGLGTGVPQPKLELAYRQDCLGDTLLLPGYANVAVDPANFAPIQNLGPFNNLSIPALKSIYIGVPGFAALNPYYARFASSAGAKVIDEIPLANGTFFTLWLGIYDILAYGILGGSGDPITPVAQFAGSLQAALAAFTANGAKGAVANIPDFTTSPFFRTIPYNLLAITDQTSVDQLNAGYAIVNQIIKNAGSTDTIHFAVGANPIVIQDASLPWGIRQIKSTEYVLLSLPQDSIKCRGWGSQKPVPPYYVLDEAEIANILSAIDSYNEQISTIVGQASGNAILVDMKSMMYQVDQGLVFDNVKISNTFASGNFYSIDGLNPTPIGNAVIVYYFIEAINEAFDANIPQVIVSDYPGVIFP